MQTKKWVVIRATRRMFMGLSLHLPIKTKVVLKRNSIPHVSMSSLIYVIQSNGAQK